MSVMGLEKSDGVPRLLPRVRDCAVRDVQQNQVTKSANDRKDQMPRSLFLFLDNTSLLRGA